jgi:hypothetical protein
MQYDDLSRTELAGKAAQEEDPQPDARAEKRPFVPPTISEPADIFQATRFFQSDTLGGPGDA